MMLIFRVLRLKKTINEVPANRKIADRSSNSARRSSHKLHAISVLQQILQVVDVITSFPRSDRAAAKNAKAARKVECPNFG